MDRNDQRLNIISIDVPAYSGTENVVKKAEFFENASLDLLKSTRRMDFVLTMKAGPALNASSPGSLILTSSATAYLLIE